MSSDKYWCQAQHSTVERYSVWLERCIEEAAREGYPYGRCSTHPTIPGLSVYEAWRTSNEQRPDPEWSLAAVEE